ncbi:hypothetical protein ACFSKW_09935 [Nonomuraea mangrovi]|uniref:Peptidase inhibitor family I36 protein n=1 Tax=Nonomuraea mangrovi TaxID=2316207 RepID=A0ABW4STT9_9ACTN
MHTVFASALIAGALALPGAPAEAPAPPPCRADVCLWTGAGYTSELFTWRAADGNVHIGPAHADRVGSFVADTEVCFVDTGESEWSWNERRRAGGGDYSPSYFRRFGHQMDRIAPARYC